MSEQLAEDGKPIDHIDADGVQWVMCACGHRAGGGVKPGDKIALCPNCAFLAQFSIIAVVYPERLPEVMTEVAP